MLYVPMTYCLPELAKCWWEPLLARGVQVDNSPPDLAWPKYEAYGTAILDIADGSFELKAGGVRAMCALHPFECPPRWELGYVMHMESTCLAEWWDLADPPLRSRGRDRVLAAVRNLDDLIGRTLLASGACDDYSPWSCRSAFRGTAELLDTALRKLKTLGARVYHAPKCLTAAERNTVGLAIDEYARVHCWGATVRLFVGEGIRPATKGPRPYIALMPRHASLDGRSSVRLAGACEVLLAEAGAVPIEIVAKWPARPGATGSPDRVLAWMSDRGERICL